MNQAVNKLDLLHTFIRVAELESFTQAAQQLGLPKSTVSEHVRQLEDLVGTRLLQRTTRRVQTTQDGLQLYERGKDMLAQMTELEGMFHPAEALRGRLRVDMPTVTARKIVLPRLGEFMAAHPDVDIEVSCTDRRMDMVREGFDCVMRVGAVTDPGVIARPLGNLPLVNCASPAYLAAYGTPHALADLAHHRLVHYVPELGTRSPGFEYQAQGQTHFQPMAGQVTVSSTEAYTAACLHGLGIVQAPLTGLADHLRAGELVAVMKAYRPAPMPLFLLFAHRRLPRRVRVFADWLGEVMAQTLAAARQVDV